MALDSPDALKRRISGDSVIEVSVQATQAIPAMEKLPVLDDKTVVELKNSTEPEKICIRTPEPARVLELLSPYSESPIHPGTGSAQPDPRRCLCHIHPGGRG